MMKATFYEGNQTITVKNVSPQKPGKGEVRIDVAYCGICGTDRHIYHGAMDSRVKMPQTIGHEMSGTIAEIGEGVTNFSVGDKAVVRPLDYRGELPSDKGYSHICKKVKFMGIDTPGAMQQSWTVPEFTVHKLPDTIDMQSAALIEPLAVACHDVKRARLQKGDTIVVIGGGPIGVLIGMVAQLHGAKVILSEINDYRLSIAKDLGFIPLNPLKCDLEKEVYRMTEDRGADVVFEVSGVSQGVQMMTALAGIRSKIVMVAIHAKPQEVNLFHFFWKELEMLGARVYEPEDYEEAIRLVDSGKFSPEKLITDIVPMEKTEDAFRSLDEDEKSIKILIDCQN